jgi:acetyl esterase
MSQQVHLEKAAKEFAEATANPPFLFDLGPEKGRETVDKVQSAPIDKPDVDSKDVMVPGGPTGEVSVRIVRPKGVSDPLPAILCIHGAGCVFGNAHTHDRLVRLMLHALAHTRAAEAAMLLATQTLCAALHALV